MTTDEVLQAEERRWAAMIGNDFDTLDELLHDSLSYTHSNAAVDTKASYIANLTNGVVSYRSVDREDTKVITSGNTAVITGSTQFSVHGMGRDITITSRYTSVWVHEDGRWQFFAWQNTPIPS